MKLNKLAGQPFEKGVTKLPKIGDLIEYNLLGENQGAGAPKICANSEKSCFRKTLKMR